MRRRRNPLCASGDILASSVAARIFTPSIFHHFHAVANNREVQGGRSATACAISAKKAALPCALFNTMRTYPLHPRGSTGLRCGAWRAIAGRGGDVARVRFSIAEPV